MKLKVREVSFKYSSNQVLEQISFDAEAGSCVAVLGTNGAGKSTLLKCIDCILRADEGEIVAGESDLGKMKPAQLAQTVGYVPQRLEFSDSTVFDVVLAGRRPYMHNVHGKIEEQDLEIVAELLERMGIDKIALRNVNAISGGEQQKVAIARALAQQPRILLFDEPTSNIDIKGQLEIIRLIKEIANKDEITVIVSMHDLNLALRFADKFIMMKDRKVFAAGDESIISSENIYQVYKIKAEVIKINERKVVVCDE